MRKRRIKKDTGYKGLSAVNRAGFAENSVIPRENTLTQAAIIADSRDKETRAPIASDENVERARNYVNENQKWKAEYKKTLLPYIIGAAMVFGASVLTGVIYNFMQGS